MLTGFKRVRCRVPFLQRRRHLVKGRLMHALKEGPVPAEKEALECDPRPRPSKGLDFGALWSFLNRGGCSPQELGLGRGAAGSREYSLFAEKRAGVELPASTTPDAIESADRKGKFGETSGRTEPRGKQNPRRTRVPASQKHSEAGKGPERCRRRVDLPSRKKPGHLSTALFLESG